ncbi:MAG: UbiA family prenyltransferase [Limnobacter sp.]|nr:UbiA family prenyltransferase [Limnobacter sp.]
MTTSLKDIIYVDLDGTLTPSDILMESCLQLLRKRFVFLFSLLVWALKGGWRLKQEIAARLVPDLAGLPLRPEVLERLRVLKADGHELVLASASLERDVLVVAQSVGLFDRVIASRTSNLKGAKKLAAIEADAAGRPFSYMGDASVDVVIWQKCQTAYAVAPSRATRFKAVAAGVKLDVIVPSRIPFKAARKSMRLQQWAKNALLFLPLLAAHQAVGELWVLALWAFLALGLVASATYIWNDLMDLPSDRKHPRKKLRPMASGELPIFQAVIWMAILGVAGFAVAYVAVGWEFTSILLIYTVCTLLYTFVLKRVAFVDVLMLGMLYTLRVLAGGVATGIAVSSWLLAISLFVFLSLALVKRCAELEFLQQEGGDTPPGRGYQMSDLSYLVSMGISSGFMAVMVLALYVDSQNGSILYSEPRILWGICPVFLFWLMRIWILTSRREMIDDPVHFALNDKQSWLCFALVAVLVVAASLV